MTADTVIEMSTKGQPKWVINSITGELVKKNDSLCLRRHANRLPTDQMMHCTQKKETTFSGSEALI